jgi:hypothetical protein
VTVSLTDLPAGCVLAGRSGALYYIVRPGVAAQVGDDVPGQTWDVAALVEADELLDVVGGTPDELRTAAGLRRRQAVVLEDLAARRPEVAR